MKDILKSYKVWLTASVTLLITLAAVCISFAGNYQELESYRKKNYESTEQQKIITDLTDENTKLRSENNSIRTADKLVEMIREYIKSCYNTDGTESENEKALKVRRYVTDKVFEQMYDEAEQPDSIPADERIVQTALIKDMVYQLGQKYQASGFVTLQIKYMYPDGRNDEQEVLLIMEFQYDKENDLWRIAGLSSSNIRLGRVWG